MARTVRFKPHSDIEPCPKCGNKEHFKIHSQQVAEDYCNIWASCKCGFCPTENNTDSRIEDVWGGTDDNNCYDAMTFTWNDVLREGILKS